MLASPLSISLNRSETGRSTESDCTSFTWVARNWSAALTPLCIASSPSTPAGIRRSMSIVAVDSNTGVIREETTSVAATAAITNVRIFQRWRLMIQTYSEREIEAPAAHSGGGPTKRQLSAVAGNCSAVGAGNARATSGSGIFLFSYGE